MAEEKKDRIYHNSAIGSWSGYIYQGVCAVYTVLHYFNEVEAKDGKHIYDDYSLYLDAFDDFSIHDETDAIISLHQCKVYSSDTNHEKAVNQMIDTCQQLKKEVVVHKDVKLYFHSNNDICKSELVTKYCDFEGKSTWNENELDDALKRLIEQIITDNKLNRHVIDVLSELYSFIDHKVVALHDEYMSGKKRLWELVREQKSGIKFSVIRDIIFKDSCERSEERYFWIKFKFAMLHSIKKYIDQFQDPEDWDDLKSDKICEMTDIFANIDAEHLPKLIGKLHPSETVKANDETYCLSSAQNMKQLLEIVGRCVHKIGNRVYWNEKGKYEIPISIAGHSKERTFLRAMDRNHSNNDNMREVDWMVSNIFSKTDNDYRNLINKVTEPERDQKESKEIHNILKQKKIGILRLEDFNNGNY